MTQSVYTVFTQLNTPGRCQAMTNRRHQCHRKATSLLLRDGDTLTHRACDLHWTHPPREWW